MKKALSLFLSLCMILSVASVGFITVAAADTTISSYDELVAFATALNADDTGMSGKTVELSADIVANASGDFNALTATEAPAKVWASITQAFKGTFDGKGYTISGLWINGTGFFNDINGATIQNVTFLNCYVNNAASSADGNGTGIVAGDAVGGTNTFTSVTVDGCHAMGLGHQIGGLLGGSVSGATVSMTSCTNSNGKVCDNQGETSLVGGLIGQSKGAVALTDCTVTSEIRARKANNANYMSGGLVGRMSGNGSTISGCSVNATIYGTCMAGGLAGQNQASVTATNCTVAGTITTGDSESTQTCNSRVGGFFGMSTGSITVSGTANSNSATLTAYPMSGYAAQAGGIVSIMTQPLSVQNFTNSGTIIGANLAAGVIGYKYYGTNLNLTNCTNTGSITAGVANQTTKSCAGGFIGFDEGAACTLNNCINSGAISDPGSNQDLSSGGLIGDVQNTSLTVSNSSNRGVVTAYRAAGGIVGSISANCSTCSFTNVFNSGNVTSTVAQAGGIVARGVHAFSVTCSANSGAMSGNYAGGLVGYAPAVVTASDFLNTGDVTASDRAGGIIGYYQNVKTGTLERCISTGTVKGQHDCVTGALIGDFTGVNEDDGVYITIKDCYYVKGNNYYASSNGDSACGVVGQSAGVKSGNLRIISTANSYDAYVLGSDSEVNSLTWQNLVKKYNKALVDGTTGAMVNNATDLQGIEGAALLASAGYDFANKWSVTDGYPVPVKAAINGTLNESAAVVYKGYQVKIDDTATLRFIAGLNSLDYKNTGFEIGVVNGSDVSAATKSTQRVYEKINVYNNDGSFKEYIAATAYDSTYLSAISVSDLPTTGTIIVTVKPFVTNESSVKVYGSMIVLTFTDGAFVSQYVG